MWFCFAWIVTKSALNRDCEPLLCPKSGFPPVCSAMFCGTLAQLVEHVLTPSYNRVVNCHNEGYNKGLNVLA